MSDYDTDILTWSEHQAALLRSIAAGEAVNEVPDWENIIEEVASVGRSEVSAVESLLFQALVHLLKVRGWPCSLAVPGWEAETRSFRAQARRKYVPSMRQRLDIAALYADALQAMPETLDGYPPQELPVECPFTLAGLLADEPPDRPLP